MPSSQIPSILNDLRSGVADSDAGAVKDAVDDLRAELDRIGPSEQALLAQAVTARDKTSLSREKRQTVDDLARVSAAVKLPRASILTLGAYYVTDASQVEDQRLLDLADSLAEEESSFVEEADRAAPVLDEVELPPTLAFVGSSGPSGARPKGTEFEAGVTLQNVGDESAEGVEISVTSDLPTTPSGVEVGALAADEDASATGSVDATAAGEFEVTFGADAADAEPTSRSVEVTVLDKAGFVDRAREDLAGVLESLEESDLPKGKAKGVRTKLEAADRKLEDAEQFAENGRARQANNMLNAASNVLGAALNQLAAGRGGKGNGKAKGNGKSGAGDDSEPTLLIGAVESLIETIATARTAEL